jgi:hypothetical protein
MGDPLTKEQLDATTAEWRERCAAVEVKSAKASPGTLSHDTTIIKSVIEAVAPHIVALEKQIAELQARISALELRPEARYLGTWSEKEYSGGSLVTHGGALWHCNKRTHDRPGSSADWTLAQKSAVAPRSDGSTVNPRTNGHYSRPRTP